MTQAEVSARSAAGCPTGPDVPVGTVTSGIEPPEQLVLGFVEPTSLADWVLRDLLTPAISAKGGIANSQPIAR
jgi:hypothetical protein